MDAASRAIVRYCIHQGHVPLAVHNGFQGFLKGEIHEMKWMDVDGWVSKAGSKIGTNRVEPNEDFGLLAFQMQKYKIHGLILVGGFEAFAALQQMAEAREHYPAFCIPMASILVKQISYI
jgi:6-phosphofructokinase 1